MGQSPQEETVLPASLRMMKTEACFQQSGFPGRMTTFCICSACFACCLCFLCKFLTIFLLNQYFLVIPWWFSESSMVLILILCLICHLWWWILGTEAVELGVICKSIIWEQSVVTWGAVNQLHDCTDMRLIQTDSCFLLALILGKDVW